MSWRLCSFCQIASRESPRLRGLKRVIAEDTRRGKERNETRGRAEETRAEHLGKGCCQLDEALRDACLFSPGVGQGTRVVMMSVRALLQAECGPLVESPPFKISTNPVMTTTLKHAPCDMCTAESP